jgi:hypothetical protein
MSKLSTTTEGVATPNRVTTHPGEVLGEEFLKPLGCRSMRSHLLCAFPLRVSAPWSRANAR